MGRPRRTAARVPPRRHEPRRALPAPGSAPRLALPRPRARPARPRLFRLGAAVVDRVSARRGARDRRGRAGCLDGAQLRRTARRRAGRRRAAAGRARDPPRPRSPGPAACRVDMAELERRTSHSAPWRRRSSCATTAAASSWQRGSAARGGTPTWSRTTTGASATATARAPFVASGADGDDRPSPRAAHPARSRRAVLARARRACRPVQRCSRRDVPGGLRPRRPYGLWDALDETTRAIDGS